VEGCRQGSLNCSTLTLPTDLNIGYNVYSFLEHGKNSSEQEASCMATPHHPKLLKQDAATRNESRREQLAEDEKTLTEVGPGVRLLAYREVAYKGRT